MTDPVLVPAEYSFLGFKHRTGFGNGHHTIGQCRLQKIEFLRSVDEQATTWFGMDYTRGTLPAIATSSAKFDHWDLLLVITSNGMHQAGMSKPVLPNAHATLVAATV